MRALPAGELTASFAVLFTVASAALFVGAAWKLNSLCFKLSVPVLAILLFYSYTKRFTSYSHLVLGFCLGMAPLGSLDRGARRRAADARFALRHRDALDSRIRHHLRLSGRRV